MKNRLIVFLFFMFSFLPVAADNLNIQALNITIDKKTKHANQTKRLRITDKEFLEQTFDIKYNSLDISKYEGANIIGDLKYVYSNRLNFGKVRQFEDVFWSFAPHDISLMFFLFY